MSSVVYSVSQSKTHSILESMFDVASGFVVALLVWIWVVKPIYGIDVNMVQNLEITGLFTAIGVGRKYIWRRIFNRIQET